MSVRSERIKSLIERTGRSYTELEKLTGIKKSSLHRYASGITTKIPLDVIGKLSSVFGVSQEYLMGWDDKENLSISEETLTEGERLWLELYRKTPEQSRPLLQLLFETFNNIPESSQQMVLGMLRVVEKEQK